MRLKLIFVLLMLSKLTLADVFTSQFCEFVLPNGWKCDMEGSEWVCQSENESRKKEAIIILAAKLRGPQDDLPQYQAYLQQAKSFKLPGGKTQISEAKYTKQIKIATQNHSWIDSLHLASEVPGFYTRYLATVKGELGVAVTFSVSKDHYDAYRPIFDKIVETLKVFGEKKAVPGDFKLAGSKSGSIPGEEGDFIDDASGRHNIGVDKQGRSKNGSGGDDMMMYLIIAAVLGGGYMLKKKKDAAKKKGTKKKKKE